MRNFCRVWLREGSITRDSCTETLLREVKKQSNTTLPQPTCHWLLDVGCFGAHSFGELSLVDYLLKAKQLSPSITNAFVMTDDATWLENEVKALTSSSITFTLNSSDVSHYKVGKLPAELGARSRVEIRADGSRRNGTRYSVDFWTSVTVARSCQSFVGHFGSAVSQLVYEAMCFHHGKVTGHCPVAADIGSTTGR